MQDLPMRVQLALPEPAIVEQQQGQQEATSLPALVPNYSITGIERAKYFGSAFLTIGGLAEVVGMGGTGILLGLVVGGTAAFFSEELRGTFIGAIIDRLPAPKQNTSRRSKLDWWLASRGQGVAPEATIVNEGGQGSEEGPAAQGELGEVLYQTPSAEARSSVRRLTIEEIVR